MITNKYCIDRKEIRNQMLESQTVGRRGGKILFGLGLMIVVAGVCSSFKDKSTIGYTLLIIAFYLFIMFDVIRKTLKVSRQYGENRFIQTIVVKEKIIEERIVNEKNEEVLNQTYEINKSIKTVSGIRYVFIYQDNKCIIPIRKDSFFDGNLKELYELLRVNTKKHEQYENKERLDFSIQKYIILFGSIINCVLAYMNVRATDTKTPVLLFFELLLMGLFFLLWISFAMTFFIIWVRKQKIFMKIISCFFFPVTFFVFSFVALFEAVKYSINIIKEKIDY